MIRFLLFILVAVFAVILSVNNREVVTVSLWPLRYKATEPAYVLILISFVLGYVFARGFAVFSDICSFFSGWRRESRIAGLEKNIAELNRRLEKEKKDSEDRRREEQKKEAEREKEKEAAAAAAPALDSPRKAEE